MGKNDDVDKRLTDGDLSSFLEGKKNVREYLISLPFEEKIRRVIEMQKISLFLKKDKTKKIYVWQL